VSGGTSDCDPGSQAHVGVQFDCGDRGYDTWNVVLCAASLTGVGVAFVAALLATGGLAAVLALIGEATTGTAAIAGCRWCKLHICGTYPGDPGTEITDYTSPTLYGEACP